MRNAGFEIRADPGTERKLKELIRRTREMGDGKTIKRELRKGLRSAINPALRRSREAARSLPSSGDSKNHLRRSIARAITPQVKMTGNPVVRIRINRSAAGLADFPNAPRNMNKGSWRHPVYGSATTNWVTQTGQRGWFDNTMLESKREVTVAVEEVINRMMGNLNG